MASALALAEVFDVVVVAVFCAEDIAKRCFVLLSEMDSENQLKIYSMFSSRKKKNEIIQIMQRFRRIQSMDMNVLIDR